MKKPLIFLLFVIIAFMALFSFSAFASTDAMDLSSFRTVYEPEIPEITLPTVVQVQSPNLQKYDVAVLEKESGVAQPWEIVGEYESRDVGYKAIDSSFLIGDLESLTDGDFKTLSEFDLDKDDGHAFLTIKAGSEMTSSSISIVLDENVSLPYEFSINAKVNEEWKTVVARKRLNSSKVNFPQTISKEWKIDFWHSQPFKVREIQLIDDKKKSVLVGETIVWLARSGEEYWVYTDADARPNIATTEKPNLLVGDDDILVAEIGDVMLNSLFQDPDVDGDGVADIRDNCVTIANTGQGDLDGNGRGDACEDHDRDGIIDTMDNCPEHPNRNQFDNDGDSIGDVCDDEESRITEKLPSLPWMAMGGAFLIIFVVFISTVKKK